MTDVWACVSQSSKMQQLLLSDSESGNSHKVPKLLSLDDYAHWKLRFETYINGVDTNLWMRIEQEYIRPSKENNTGLIEINRMSQEQRKAYDEEKKAYALLSQAIPREILHQFQSCSTSFKLWEVLRMRNEGNSKLKKLKANALRKEFNSFSYMAEETLGDIVTRFYHLISELHQHGVDYSVADQIQCIADALPPKWDAFLMVMRQSNDLENIGFNEFIQKLQEQEVEERRKSTRTAYGQDPSLYYSTIPKASAKLETAFASGVGSSPCTPSPQPQVGGHGGSQPINNTSSQSNNSSSQANSTTVKPSNLGKVTVEVAKEHMALVAALVVSYDDMVAGRIGNPHLTQEDYDQLDSDEMELMDIKWALASAVRRAKEYVKRTGKELNGSKDTKFGFDKSKVTCYNCGNKGHFARECNKPKQTQNKNPFTRNNNDKPKEDLTKAMVIANSSQSTETSNSSQALVTQNDEGYDWSFKFDSGDTQNSACLADVKIIIASEEDASSDDDFSVDAAAATIKIEEIQEGGAESPAGSQSLPNLFAFMADSSDSKQNEVPSKPNCDNCVEKDERIQSLMNHNQKLVDDLTRCMQANEALTKNEKEF